MRHQIALGAGLATGVAALALAISPQIAGAVGLGSAGTGQPGCPATGQTSATGGTGQGYGPARAGRMGAGMTGRQSSTTAPGRTGAGRGAGTATDSTVLGTGSLSTASRTTVASMAEEEKLAHDVYTALAARYPAEVRFTRIATSETQHLAALRQVMTAYGITDPTAGLADDRFASASVQQVYDDLLAKATTLDAALSVGRAVETKDIADLDAAMAAVTAAPDVDRVYSHLRAASQMHLRAFGG